MEIGPWFQFSSGRLQEPEFKLVKKKTKTNKITKNRDLANVNE